MLKTEESSKLSWVEEQSDLSGENSKETDAILEALSIIGASIHEVPEDISLNLSISIVFSILAQRNLPILLKAPQKTYKIVRQYILDQRTKTGAPYL